MRSSTARNGAVYSLVGQPSVMSTSTVAAPSAEPLGRGAAPASNCKAPPRSLSPPASRSVHWQAPHFTGFSTCQAAASAKASARTHVSSQMCCARGRAARMPEFRAAIHSPTREPERSQIKIRFTLVVISY